jgi:hypothetical protein
MGTTDLLVVYVVLIDHVMYVLAENRAWKGVVGMGSIGFLVSYIVFIDHEYCDYNDTHDSTNYSKCARYLLV